MSGPSLAPRPIESSVAAAALWLRRQNTAPRLAVVTLKERFHLDTVRALEAITLARGLNVRRATE
jgi:hypothetical protein